MPTKTEQTKAVATQPVVNQNISKQGGNDMQHQPRHRKTKFYVIGDL